MVLVQLGVGVTDALARLRAYAFVQQRLLTDVARDVVERRLVFTEETWTDADAVTRTGPVMSQPDLEQRVSAAFVVLADTPVDDHDIIDLLDQLVAHCVALLAADAAGIMLADARQQLRPVAASSEDVQTMELLQLQSDEGPCLEAYQTASLVRVPDLTQMADRWPHFVATAARTSASPRCTPSRCGCVASPSVH
jgi:hypothetical protein